MTEASAGDVFLKDKLIAQLRSQNRNKRLRGKEITTLALLHCFKHLVTSKHKRFSSNFLHRVIIFKLITFVYCSLSLKHIVFINIAHYV